MKNLIMGTAIFAGAIVMPVAALAMVTPSSTPAPSTSPVAIVLPVGGSAATGAEAGTLTQTVTGSAATGAISNGTTVPVPPTAGASTNGAVSNSGSTSTLPTSGTTTTGATGSTSTPTTTGGTPGSGSTTSTGNANTGGSFYGGSGGLGGQTGGLIGTSSDTTVSGGFVTGDSSTSTCPLITSYMKRGRTNDPIQVAKLQAFLKDSEHLDVAVTGTFDARTEAAVDAFQEKYLQSVLGPWDATLSSGMVYITTSKKINELACASPLTLNTSELAIINAFKAARKGQTVAATSEATVASNGSTDSTSTDVVSNTLTVSGSDQAANTASVGNLSIFQRFWNFIVSLFR